MTYDEAPRHQVESYFRMVADMLGLKDWKFHIQWDEPLDDPNGNRRLAMTRARRSSKTARIWLSKDFFEEPADRQRECMVHEVLHWQFEPMAQFVDEIIEEYLGREARKVALDAFWQQFEYGIDGTAIAFAAFLKDPPWCGPEPKFSMRFGGVPHDES